MKPKSVRIGRDNYHAAVLLVTDRDSLGRPLVARFIHPEEQVSVRELGGDSLETAPQFIIVYINHETWGKP